VSTSRRSPAPAASTHPGERRRRRRLSDRDRPRHDRRDPAARRLRRPLLRGTRARLDLRPWSAARSPPQAQSPRDAATPLPDPLSSRSDGVRHASSHQMFRKISIWAPTELSRSARSS
jgi:hypothetical protein